MDAAEHTPMPMPVVDAKADIFEYPAHSMMAPSPLDLERGENRGHFEFSISRCELRQFQEIREDAGFTGVSEACSAFPRSRRSTRSLSSPPSGLSSRDS